MLTWRAQSHRVGWKKIGGGFWRATKHARSSNGENRISWSDFDPSTGKEKSGKKQNIGIPTTAIHKGTSPQRINKKSKRKTTHIIISSCPGFSFFHLKLCAKARFSRLFFAFRVLAHRQALVKRTKINKEVRCEHHITLLFARLHLSTLFSFVIFAPSSSIHHHLTLSIPNDWFLLRLTSHCITHISNSSSFSLSFSFSFSFSFIPMGEQYSFSYQSMLVTKKLISC